MKKVINAHEAISHIRSDFKVFIHGGAATPQTLIKALVSRASELKNVNIYHLHTHGDPVYAHPEYHQSFKVNNLFIGGNMRPYINFKEVDYIPCFLSEIPSLFRTQKIPLDVALLHVSVPDQHGFCTLGTSVDVAKAAFESAKMVIAQVNPCMPRVHGDGMIHVNDIDYLVEVNEPIFTTETKKNSEIEKKIGQHTASLIDNGACLQAGIGAIPDAVLAELVNHKHLGLHTEMWSDGALELLKKGVIDNTKKSFHKGKSVSSFVTGSQKVYDYLNDNPTVVLLEASYTNNPRIIARNSKVTSINSAVEVDLTGQVCADSIGRKVISGIGGQVDFIRGASLSEDGKPIIALPSRTKDGKSRLVCTLHEGAGVVTTRGHVHFVVTEYGVADLFGKTISERARSLIQIAHPEDRELLEKQWLALS